MKEVAHTIVLDRLKISQWKQWIGNTTRFLNDPFEQDVAYREWVQERAIPDNFYGKLKLAHCYAGCLTETIQELFDMGVKVSYTAAAHNVEVSRKAHLDAGFPFNYPHLTDPELWKRYVDGYLQADLVICPSKHSAGCMRSYGCKNVTIISHGVDLPELDKIKPLPKNFVCGYLGNCSAPDKGLIYLLKAWGKLNYKDAVLVLAGRDSNSPYVQQMINEHAGNSSVVMMGWAKNIADFYNGISLYLQPSLTEGFGIEVLEALAYKRPVICSRGAGSCDLVPFEDYQVFSHDEEGFLESQIDYIKQHPEEWNCLGSENREVAEKHSWSIIRQRYIKAWKGLLNG